MQNIEKSLTLALDGRQGDQRVETRADDFESRFLTLDFTDRSEPFVLPAVAEIRVNFRRIGGDVLSFSTSQEQSVLEIDGNRVRLKIPQSVASKKGVVLVDVSILEDGKKLTSESFRLVVNPAVGSAESFSESENADILSNLIAAAGEAVSSADGLVALIAEKIENGDFNGPQGEPGRDGENGRDGADGFSPTVSVSEIENGKRVTVTDALGSRSFDIFNGEDGSDGGITPADYASIAQLVLSGISIPSATSDLTNDSGFLTLATLPVYDGTVSDGGEG